MRILIVCDKIGSAIHSMALGVQKYNPYLHIDVIDVHPKRPSPEQIGLFLDLAQKADILSFEYWKTYIMLREQYSEIMSKPKILAHHNPYNLF